VRADLLAWVEERKQGRDLGFGGPLDRDRWPA
jgi:hypothetical protein